MEINKHTKVADILEAYGDIAEVMELFGVQRVGRYSLRSLAAKALTVEWAARIHKVPLDEFLQIVREATGTLEKAAPEADPHSEQKEIEDGATDGRQEAIQ